MPVAHRIYARALFEAASDESKLDAVREELVDLVAAIDQVAELRSVLENPEVDSRAKGDILADVLSSADPLVQNFLRLVAEKGRAGEIAEVVREYEALVDAAENVLNVELTTAFELSDDDAGEIVGKIERASGRTIEASRTVNPSLIGGLVLQAGSLRVDASVRGRLERLRQELLTARS
jgi:F-type H+-transporting ATPase subunit delta